MKSFLTLLTLLGLYTANAQQWVGHVVREDAALDQLIDSSAKVEVLSAGFTWTEGPVWVKQLNCLLFSDAPLNTIYKWKAGEGITTFLKPSGYTGLMPYSKEPGSNGLLINNRGELVACEHGDRRISALPLNHSGKRTLADNYNGRRFNSPNDIIQRSNGDYYFTDPEYGLPADSMTGDRLKGVYRLTPAGKVDLVVDSLLPNGLVLSPDEKTLYVGESSEQHPYIMSYRVRADGLLEGGKIFYDASALMKKGLGGLPDGMKIDAKGNFFATGPGGIHIISPAGKLLGRIELPDVVANCAWGDDGSTLYITAHTMLCRIKTKTKGVIK